MLVVFGIVIYIIFLFRESVYISSGPDFGSSVLEGTDGVGCGVSRTEGV